MTPTSISTTTCAACDAIVWTTPRNLSTILLVFVLRSVWSIALGLVLAETTGLVLSYILVTGRAHFSFSKQRLKEMLGYGQWMTLTAIVLFCASQFDSVIIARMLGAVELGYYRTADMFSRLLLNDLSVLVAAISTPMYARLLQDTNKCQEIFLYSIKTAG